jgi:pimeloyl-ACP methyl ester carboxylesterase
MRYLTSSLLLLGVSRYVKYFKNLSKIHREYPELPGTRGTLEINGQTVGYRVHVVPEAKRAVLVHGWGSSADLTWMALMRSGEVSFLALDIPGYGESSYLKNITAHQMAHLFNMAVRLLGFTDAALVAHSYGGIIASSMYKQEPEFFRGLVMVSSTKSFKRFPLSLYVKIAPYVLGKHSPLSVRAAHKEIQSHGPDAAAWRWSQRPGFKSMAAAARAIREIDDSDWCDENTHWIVPEKDRCIRPALQTGCAGSSDTITRVAMAGHGFHETDPDVVIDAIKHV